MPFGQPADPLHRPAGFRTSDIEAFRDTARTRFGATGQVRATDGREPSRLAGSTCHVQWLSSSADAFDCETHAHGFEDCVEAAEFRVSLFG